MKDRERIQELGLDSDYMYFFLVYKSGPNPIDTTFYSDPQSIEMLYDLNQPYDWDLGIRTAPRVLLERIGKSLLAEWKKIERQYREYQKQEGISEKWDLI